jgi:hypothetical protein
MASRGVPLVSLSQRPGGKYHLATCPTEVAHRPIARRGPVEGPLTSLMHLAEHGADILTERVRMSLAAGARCTVSADGRTGSP